jgi:murein L,D-transpeptidase YafK
MTSHSARHLDEFGKADWLANNHGYDNATASRVNPRQKRERVAKRYANHVSVASYGPASIKSRRK